MARLTGGLFGSLSGKVGDLVYRNRGGKTVVAATPSKRSSPRTEHEIKLGKIFGLTGKIARGINSTELLKQFWHPKAARNQSCYNIIFKKNYGRMNFDNLRGEVLLTPETGFDIMDPSLYPGESNLVIECKALGYSSSFDTKIEKYVIVAGIVILKNPIPENIEEYTVLSFKSKKYLLYPNEYLSLNIEFSGCNRLMFESYSLKKVFANFITLDEEEAPVQHSMAFSNKD
jgi:hypothetical protein